LDLGFSSLPLNVLVAYLLAARSFLLQEYAAHTKVGCPINYLAHLYLPAHRRIQR